MYNQNDGLVIHIVDNEAFLFDSMEYVFEEDTTQFINVDDE